MSADWLDETVRRRIAIGVFVLAGFACLATTPASPSIEANQTGHSEVGPGGTDLHATVRIRDYRSGYTTPEGTLGLSVQALHGVVVAMSSSADRPDSPMNLSNQISFSTAECESACEFQYDMRLQLVDTGAAPLMVPWVMTARSPGSGEIDLEVMPEASSPGLLPLATVSVAIGFLIALVAAVAMLRANQSRDRRMAAAEAFTSGLLIVVGLLLTSRGLNAMGQGVDGLFLAAAGLCTAVGGVVTRSWLRRPGLWLWPVGLVVVPLVVVRLVYAGVFRPLDVVVTMVASGFALAMCVAELAYVLAPLIGRLDLRNGRAQAMIGATTVVVALSATTIVAIISGPRDQSTTVFPFVIIGIAALISFWLWLKGHAVGALIGAIAVVIIAACLLLLYGAVQLLSRALSGGFDLTGILVLGISLVLGVVMAIISVGTLPLRASPIHAASGATSNDLYSGTRG